MAERRNAARGRREGRAGGLGLGPRGGGAPELSALLEVAPEVAEAIAAGKPVVALETSIVGQGLPAPHNLEAAYGSEAAIRAEGAVPATIAVVDGRLRVGVTHAEIERIAEHSVKVSSRDLGPAIARGSAGATTIAATVHIAAMAGIRFMATGGIGGVHRGRPEDESADLLELSRSAVAVFCSGAKIILDLALTLERLETLAVPVLGYKTDEFPAFYTRHSGCRVSARVDDAAEAARVLRASWDAGSRGVVVAVPPPAELEGADEMTRRAVAEVDAHGAELTPLLLARVAELSSGRSVQLNVELVVNNARVAARVARVFTT